MQAADLVSVSRSPPSCDLDGIRRYRTEHCVRALHRKYLCLSEMFACFTVLLLFFYLVVQFVFAVGSNISIVILSIEDRWVDY